jgi:hypothetical protein
LAAAIARFSDVLFCAEPELVCCYQSILRNSSAIPNKTAKALSRGMSLANLRFVIMRESGQICQFSVAKRISIMKTTACSPFFCSRFEIFSALFKSIEARLPIRR